MINVRYLIVEVDAKYIKGMINNPDMQPNATINRWIAGILLFTFELVHVPGKDHGPSDGLSRRGRAEGDPPEDEDYEDWIDTQYCFVVWILSAEDIPEPSPDDPVIPRSEKADAQEAKLDLVRAFLRNPARIPGMSDQEFVRFTRYAINFFQKGSTLWRKGRNGKHRIVVPADRRYSILKQAHDDLGHKGVY